MLEFKNPNPPIYAKFTPSPRTIVLMDPNGNPLVTISLDDGTHTFGPNYKPDEAAKIFWEAVRFAFPGNPPAAPQLVGLFPDPPQH